MILVDTNVLLRMIQPKHSMHSQAISALTAMRRQNEDLCIVPQVLYEFWVVATRPIDANGLGMSVVEADTDLAKIIQRFRLIRDERAIFDLWRRLVTDHHVLGKSAHDARLVAAMERHGIKKIVSFNAADFKRYSGVTAVDPAESFAAA